LFEPHFIRCHTGFIVNLLYFEKLEGNDMILLSGERVPVSRNRKKDVLSRIEKIYSEGWNREQVKGLCFSNRLGS